MKGRRSFSNTEAQSIRSVLLERPRTKETRDKLRAIGFYISDFSLSSPFSVEDFDRLIASGEIKIEASAATKRPTSAKVNSPQSRRMVASDTSRAEEERLKYRPLKIKYLLVGESAPAGGTFFYFANSILFFQTLRAFKEVFGVACGDGTAFLRFFQEHGFYLDDLCLVPVNGLPDDERYRQRIEGIEPLADRIKSVNPEGVIVVMKGIVPEVSQACRIAGINPPDLMLPFPSRPEHQKAFVRDLAKFLRSIR